MLAHHLAGERMPLVVLHQRGGRYTDALVVTRLSHWLERKGDGLDVV